MDLQSAFPISGHYIAADGSTITTAPIPFALGLNANADGSDYNNYFGSLTAVEPQFLYETANDATRLTASKLNTQTAEHSTAGQFLHEWEGSSNSNRRQAGIFALSSFSSTATGDLSSSSGPLVAGRFYTYKDGTANANSIYGLEVGHTTNAGAAGDVTTYTGLKIQNPAMTGTSGTIGTAYGIDLPSFGGSSLITTQIGLRIPAGSGGSFHAGILFTGDNANILFGSFASGHQIRKDSGDQKVYFEQIGISQNGWEFSNEVVIDHTLSVTGATTLASSLTGIGKLTAGLVGIASSADILAAIDFGTVMLKTDAGATTFYKPSADSDAARGTALAAAIAAHAAGDTIVVGPGDYQLSASFTLLTGASLIGQGRPFIYATGLTDALVRLVNSDILVQGIDVQTDAIGFGVLSVKAESVSGIVLRDVTHTPSAASNTSGLQFTQVIGGGVQEHVVQLNAYNSKFYGGSTLGYGVHMNLASGSEVNLWNCDVYGATDGLLNKTTGGTSTGVTNVYGGKYASVLDAITSGGGTSNVINVYGATARGDQADIYGDDGRVNVYWSDFRTEYIVGNGVSQTNISNVIGHANIIAGQLTLSDWGGAPDVGIARVSSSAIRASNASSGRIDFEVADEAYDGTAWNGSFEVPTKNAVRDILEAYTTTGNITISKATPGLVFTDSGGDDYIIDVGSTASLLRIRNTTDSTNAFQVDGSGNVAVSTSYAPQSGAKFYAQDRTTSPSATARAAFTATQEVVPSGAFTGGNQRGFLGGVSFIANQNSTAGAAMIGLEGGVTVISTAGFTQTALNGLFGTLNYTGGSTITLSNAVSTFVSLGTGSVATTLRHIAVGSSQATGGASVGTLIGFYAPAMTLGTTANYEGWMDTDAGWFFREGGNQINSRAAATLDIDATTTLNFRVGGAIEATLTANRLTFNNGASDTYLDWTTSGRLDVGGGIFRANGTAVIQATDFTPHSSGYELSVQSNSSVTYIEILNSAGANTGAFFGMENDVFALYNWQGSAAGSGNYPIVFFGGFGAGELMRLDKTGGTVFNDTGGDIDWRLEGDTLTHAIFLDASSATENIALLAAAAPNWQAMDRGLFIGNATTVPTGNPTAGGFLYAEAGALKWRGTSGTITTLGAA